MPGNSGKGPASRAAETAKNAASSPSSKGAAAAATVGGAAVATQSSGSIPAPPSGLNPILAIIVIAVLLGAVVAAYASDD